MLPNNVVSELPRINVSDIPGEAPQFLFRGGPSTTRRGFIIRILCWGFRNKLNWPFSFLSRRGTGSRDYDNPRDTSSQGRRAVFPRGGQGQGHGGSSIWLAGSTSGNWRINQQVPPRESRWTRLGPRHSKHRGSCRQQQQPARGASTIGGVARWSGPTSCQHRSCSRGVARRKGGVSGLKRATLGRGMHQPRGDSQEARRARQTGRQRSRAHEGSLTAGSNQESSSNIGSRVRAPKPAPTITASRGVVSGSV